MIITVWQTERKLNRTITDAACHGLTAVGHTPFRKRTKLYDGQPCPSVSYGFLRGTGKIYRDCARAGIDWWNIDKGFFGAQHTSGFYRLGQNHLQPFFRHDITCDDSRWWVFGLEILPWRFNRDGHLLICPPTTHTSNFYGTHEEQWIEKTLAFTPPELRSRVVIRRKGAKGPCEAAFDGALCVVTHSSNVAIEAIRLGVPAISETGFVASWSGLTTSDLSNLDYFFSTLSDLDRNALFHQAAWNQFTLREFASGYAWLHGLQGIR